MLLAARTFLLVRTHSLATTIIVLIVAEIQEVVLFTSSLFPLFRQSLRFLSQEGGCEHKLHCHRTERSSSSASHTRRALTASAKKHYRPFARPSTVSCASPASRICSWLDSLSQQGVVRSLHRVRVGCRGPILAPPPPNYLRTSACSARLSLRVARLSSLRRLTKLHRLPCHLQHHTTGNLPPVPRSLS